MKDLSDLLGIIAQIQPIVLKIIQDLLLTPGRSGGKILGGIQVPIITIPAILDQVPIPVQAIQDLPILEVAVHPEVVAAAEVEEEGNRFYFFKIIQS